MPTPSARPLVITEQPTPATPPDGFGAIYIKSDGKAYMLSDAGVETPLGNGIGVIVCTIATRPPHAVGQMIFQTDNSNMYVSDGTQWTVPKTDYAYRIVTSATRPAGPLLVEGWMIYETDTNLQYVYDGAAWQPVGGGGGGSSADAEVMMWMTRV